MEIPGVNEISMFSRIKEDEVASLLFVCDDRETAEVVQESMKGILKKHNTDIGFHTEFVFKLLDNVKRE